MVVGCIENRDDPPPEDMYDDVAIHNENVLKLDEEDVKDDAHIVIDVETFLAANQQKLNQNNDAIDLELLGKCNQA